MSTDEQLERDVQEFLDRGDPYTREPYTEEQRAEAEETYRWFRANEERFKEIGRLVEAVGQAIPRDEAAWGATVFDVRVNGWVFSKWSAEMLVQGERKRYASGRTLFRPHAIKKAWATIRLWHPRAEARSVTTP